MARSLSMERPLGVTILAVLAIISGVLGLLVTLSYFGRGAAASTQASTVGPLVWLFGIAGVVALLQLIYGIGLWTLKPWAWVLAIIVTILGLLNSAYMVLGQQQYGAIFGAVLALVILFYLFRPDVKAAFHR